jgi:Ras-related protein Rab-1A
MANQPVYYDYLFKLLLTGAPSAGKTSFLTRCMYNTFYENYIPVGIFGGLEVVRFVSPETSNNIKLQMWDPVERIAVTHLPSYYRAAHGILVMFDCTDRENSFDRIPTYFDRINSSSPETVKIILVATKIDLVNRRQVSYEEAKELADQLGIPYVETSSKNDINIREAIKTIVLSIERDITNRLERSPPTKSDVDSSPRKFRCIML